MNVCALISLATIIAATSAVSAADWPNWRGPTHDDISTEPSGYDGKTWPLKEAWQADVGDGSTSPLVVGDRVYSMGNRNGRDTVVCLDAATGKTLWSVDYPCPPFGRKANGDQGLYRGTSSTPTFDAATGILYTLSSDGDLHAWNTRERGAKLWHLNLYEEYDPPQRPKVGRSGQRDYGYTTAPLIVGDTVIVQVGGKHGNTIAFDKRSGKQIWASENTDPAGHSGGLVSMTIENVPCVAVMTHFHLLVLRIDAAHAGETVAEYPWVTNFSNSIAAPAVQDHFVIITSGYNHQTMCKLDISLTGAKKIWQRDVYSKVCTPVIHDGHIYWSWQNVYCLDFETGQQRWAGPAGLSDPGSCIVTADDRLIVLSAEGTLLLMETAQRSPREPKILFRRDRLFRSDAWPHVVFANGRLLCKDRDGNLKCFTVGE